MVEWRPGSVDTLFLPVRGRLRMKRCFVLWIVLVASSLAQAQLVPTRASSDEIDQWLLSGDPRMVAWGASFAARTADTDEVPVLASLVANYQGDPPQQYDSGGNAILRTSEQQQRLDSMQVVLDSLIELHGTVAYEGVVAVLPDFPAQALTLFATMHEPERTQRAVAVYATRDRADNPVDWHQSGRQQMIHMAAAILSLRPPAGFTATLLNETTITLKISVTDDDQRSDGTVAGCTCGDSVGLVPNSGWPPAYTYVVEQHWKIENSKEAILVPGEPAITARRASSNSSCSALDGFGSVQRLQLARQEAGLASGALSNGPVQYDTLRYSGTGDYLAGLSTLIESHRTPFRAFAATLAGRSLLTPAEAETAMPAFEVEIEDQRRDKTQPLPQPTSMGSRISFGPYKPETGQLVRQLN